MTNATQAARLLRYVRSHGIVRPRDLESIQVDRRVLKRLFDCGELVRRSRGVYTMPDHEATRHTELAEVCARAPTATVCLISALDFHELTTQIAHAVWIMIDRAARRPKIEQPRIHVVYASGEALEAGLELHEIEGVRVRITGPAKTVADCFKYRAHVGHDVGVEALRDCLGQRKATPAQIYGMAKIDRVTKTVRPYLEALT
ncbi:MAG: type IV toxin-antitoxin system AbiEi family antitoxin domain-containing protein [Planctomycetota bacterium]